MAQIAASHILHASGISQAISESCADAAYAAMRHARQSGTTISYDTNLRLRLWPLDRARAIIHGAVALSDIALPGLDDAQQLTGLERPEEICDFYLQPRLRHRRADDGKIRHAWWRSPVDAR